MNHDKKVVWVTWERQIRNQSMSARLGADFFQILYKKPRLTRYIKSTLKTLKIFYLVAPEKQFKIHQYKFHRTNIHITRE
jgi:hypothetical protein